MGKGGGPADTLTRENERIARFLLRLEDLERQRSATKASRTHLQKLARYDSTVSSRLHHEETDVPTLIPALIGLFGFCLLPGVAFLDRRRGVIEQLGTSVAISVAFNSFLSTVKSPVKIII